MCSFTFLSLSLLLLKSLFGPTRVLFSDRNSKLSKIYDMHVLSQRKMLFGWNAHKHTPIFRTEGSFDNTHTHIVGGSHRVLVVVFLLLTMHRNAPVKSTSCNIEKVNNFNWHSHTLSHKFCQALVRHFSYHLIKREKNKQKQQQQPH